MAALLLTPGLVRDAYSSIITLGGQQTQCKIQTPPKHPQNVGSTPPFPCVEGLWNHSQGEDFSCTAQHLPLKLHFLSWETQQ